MKPGREQRGVFRVAVKSGTDLEATLLIAGQSWRGTVQDLSPEGLFVELARGVVPSLRVDSAVNVDVTFEGETFRLYGVVRSQHDGGYGIFFPECDRHGRVNPRARLARISTQLQRTDLSQRLKVLKLPE